MLHSKMAGAISLVRVARCNGARLYVLSQDCRLASLTDKKNSKYVERYNDGFLDTCLS